MLADVDQLIFQSAFPRPQRLQVLRLYKKYIEVELRKGTPLNRMSRHLLGLFQGVPGCRAWRRHLSRFAVGPGAGLEVINEAETFIVQAANIR